MSHAMTVREYAVDRTAFIDWKDGIILTTELIHDQLIRLVDQDRRAEADVLFAWHLAAGRIERIADDDPRLWENQADEADDDDPWQRDEGVPCDCGEPDCEECSIVPDDMEMANIFYGVPYPDEDQDEAEAARYSYDHAYGMLPCTCEECNRPHYELRFTPEGAGYEAYLPYRLLRVHLHPTWRAFAPTCEQMTCICGLECDLPF
jgi:hypothetical protein